jgi:hypothetical protein
MTLCIVGFHIPSSDLPVSPCLEIAGDWTVMKRIGMTMTEMFEHPGLPTDSPLRSHCLYRLTCNS